MHSCYYYIIYIRIYLTNFFNLSPSPPTKVPFASSSQRALPLVFPSESIFGFLNFFFFPFFSLSSLLYLRGKIISSVRRRFQGDCVLTMRPSEALLLATCPENQGVKAVISVAVMFFLATIVVAIRFYVRLVMLHGATGWDDYFILGSLVSFFSLFLSLYFLCSPDRPLLEKGRRGGGNGGERSGLTLILWPDLKTDDD